MRGAARGWCAAALLGLGAPALAAEDAGRLKQDIGALLRDMAGRLDRAEEQTGGARVQDALSKASELERKLEKLKGVAAGDREAGEWASRWPAHVREFRQAAGALLEMKGLQGIQQKAPANCKKVSQELQGKMDALVKARDPEGLTSLPKEGRKWGPPIQRMLEEYDAKRRQLQRLHDAASSFRASDAGWASVSKELRDSAKTILQHYDRDNQDAHDACDRLAMGERNVDIQDAVKALQKAREKGQDTLEGVEQDYARWVQRLKDLQRWHQAGEEAIAKALCEPDEDEARYDIEEGVVLDAASRVKSKLKAEWDTVSELAKDLQERLAPLEKSPDPKQAEQARKLATTVKRRMKTLERSIQGSGVLRGSNNPRVRTRLEVGKKEHERLQRDRSLCHVAEVTLPGKSMRLDCVRVDGRECVIVEIKPDTPAAERKGRKRLGDYQKAVEDLWSRSRSTFKGKLDVFNKCVDPGGAKLRLDTQLKTYPFCKQRYEQVTLDTGG